MLLPTWKSDSLLKRYIKIYLLVFSQKLCLKYFNQIKYQLKHYIKISPPQIDCLLDDGVLKRNGQTWNNECKTCSCNNGRVTCEQKTCDCNAIKNINYIDDDSANNNNIDEGNFISKCCSECFVEEKSNVSSCTNSDGVTNYVTGETWLQNCQQCECKVRLFSIHIFSSILYNIIIIYLINCDLLT